MFLPLNSDYFFKKKPWLVFLISSQCVLCELRIKLLDII